MKLEFAPDALKCYQTIKNTNPEKTEKIKGIIRDILMHPEIGIGEPTTLDGKLKGVWQRTISYNEFIYYFFDSEVVTVAALIITLPNDITDIDASFKLEEFSENDYASVMALMAANRGKDSEPKVGLRRT